MSVRSPSATPRPFSDGINSQYEVDDSQSDSVPNTLQLFSVESQQASGPSQGSDVSSFSPFTQRTRSLNSYDAESQGPSSFGSFGLVPDSPRSDSARSELSPPPNSIVSQVPSRGMPPVNHNLYQRNGPSGIVPGSPPQVESSQSFDIFANLGGKI